jgi:hypothetical protein
MGSAFLQPPFPFWLPGFGAFSLSIWINITVIPRPHFQNHNSVPPFLSNLRPFYFYVVYKHDYGHMTRKSGLILHRREAAILFNIISQLSSVLSSFCIFFNQWVLHLVKIFNYCLYINLEFGIVTG